MTDVPQGSASPSPPAPPPPPTPSRPPTPGTGINRTPVIVAVGVVLTAAAIGLIVARFGDDDGDDSAGPSPITEAPSAATDPTDDTITTTEPSDDTTTTTEPSTTIDGLEVVDSGFSTYEGFDGMVGSYGLILENTTDEPITNFTVEVVIYDTTDTVVSSDPHTVAVVNPGARLGLGAEVADALPNGIGRVDVQVEEGSGGPVPEGAFTISDVSTSSDEFGIYTAFVVSSTYDVELELPYAYAVYRDAAGRIIGGANGFVDVIPARGRANGEVTSFEVVPNVAEAEVYVDPGFF
jgi:hypothetical protein